MTVTIPRVIPKFDGQDTRLIEAAQCGKLAKVRELIKEGLDVNDADGKGVTPLIMASCAGHLNVVEALLRAGADTSVKDDLGYDAYHAAMFFGDFRGAPLPPYDQIMAVLKQGKAHGRDRDA